MKSTEKKVNQSGISINIECSSSDSLTDGSLVTLGDHSKNKDKTNIQ